jgi:hypothetical protein
MAFFGEPPVGTLVGANIRFWPKADIRCDAMQCPLSGVKGTLTNRCSSTSIYEYTPGSRRRAVNQPLQRQVRGVLDISVGEATALQLQPRRNTLQKVWSLLHIQPSSSIRNELQLTIW